MITHIIFILGLLFGMGAQAAMVQSPDGRIRLDFELRQDGRPGYLVVVEGDPVMDWSALGYDLKDTRALVNDFAILSTSVKSVDETWEQVWGEERWIRNRYNELRVSLQEQVSPARRLNFIFRVFDDGIGFRYEIPAQPELGEFTIMNERTEFNFTRDHQSWWIEAFHDQDYEQHYRKTAVSAMPSVMTPLTIEAGRWLFSIHEASLIDYAGMYLANWGAGRLKAELFPWSDGTLVKTRAPMESPWRTIQIARTPGDLITSYLILNLNEPNRIGDTSWIRPLKYLGIWWGMHIGRFTWASGDNHGATTERAERYIRAGRDLGIPGLLIEGWNLGWDGDWMKNGDQFNFTQAYPDFDLQRVAAMAKENGVELIGHHETAGGISNYERQMEEAFRLYRDLGVHRVKTGYVSPRMEGREWRHSQYMVRHHQRVTEAAIRYQISLNIHEPIKDTGLRRTYPNIMTREGACGAEYDAWGGDNHNPPSHHTIIPFTRGLSGPFDYTPGIFDLLTGKTERDRVRTTLAKQLALYLVIYSPMQMAADQPENYAFHPAFKFIQDVPVDWETTRVLGGVIGEFITVARKDRASDDWYVGSVSNEKGRRLTVPLDFLDAGRVYDAEIYADAPDSHYLNKPLAYEIRTIKVKKGDQIDLVLAPGGGAAIRFRYAVPFL